LNIVDGYGKHPISTHGINRYPKNADFWASSYLPPLQKRSVESTIGLSDSF
jgi:hypothetical protein